MKLPILARRTTALLLLLTPLATGVQGTRRVHVVTPGKADLEQTVPLLGSVMPLRSVTIVPRVTGYLSEVGFEEGDVLEASAVIARIAVPELEAARDIAAAMVNEAQARVASERALVEDAKARVGEKDKQIKVALEHVTVREAEVATCEAELLLHELIVRRKEQLREGHAATEEELERAQGELAMAQARGLAAQAAIGMARAEVESSKARLRTAETAVVSAQAGLLGAEAALETSRAEQRRSEVLLGFGSLHSPYPSALVAVRLLDEGALVKAHETPVAVLMDVSRMRVQVQVPESMASSVLPGSPVTLVIDSRAEEPIRAEVTRRAAALDVTTRTMRVEVELDNASGRLLPGMFCHALIEVAQREDAMTLPGATIRTAGKQDFVFVVEGGRVARRDVQLGMDNGILVEVASGLSGDEQVVVGQVAGLQEGDAVEVQEK